MSSLYHRIGIQSLIFLLGLVFLFPQDLSAKPPILSKRYQNKSPGRVIRTCCAFGSDLRYIGVPFVKRNDIIDRKELGLHHFMGGRHEKNGIIYTQHGGFIDIGHLRDYADWTAYLYVQIELNKSEINSTTIKLGAEGGKKRLSFNVSNDMTSLDHLNLAGSIAYDLSLWHEIATYFGVSLIPVILPEKFSSFSPEDVYSNLLGTIIGMKAIESEKEYDIAVTAILDEILDHLGAVDQIEESYAAMSQVESLWWNSKKPLPGKKFLLKRNLDTAIELLPWLVDDDSNSVAYTLPKPDSQIRKMYTLSLRLNEKFPLDDILPKDKTREINQHDFQSFVNYIKQKDQEEKDAEEALILKRAKKRFINLLKIVNNDHRRSSK